MIDETFKDQLLGALRVAVGHVNDGAGPNDAVAKAAMTADFNAEQTNRLCELYNTSRTIYHFENHPEEKTAEFELVDKSIVSAAVFGTAMKAAAVHDTEVPVHGYTEYESRELDMRNGKRAEALPLPTVDLLDVPELEAQSQRITRIVRTQYKLAEHAFSEARCALGKAAQAAQHLAAMLCEGYYQHGTDKYARLIRSYDTKAAYAPVLATLKVHLPKYMEVSAEQLKKLGYVIDDGDLAAEQAMLDEIKDALEGAAGVEALGREVQKSASDIMRQFETIITPVSQPAANSNEFDEFFTPAVKSGQVTTSTTQPDYTVSQILTGKEPGEAKITTSTPSMSQAIESATKATQSVGVGIDSIIGQGETDFNAKLMARLKNQQREVLLQDLLTNDPFIAEASPQAVAAIYTQIMQLAPEVSLNKEVVRGVLRQSLHNVTAVSPFDASAWTDLEKTINEVRGTLPDKKRPPVSGAKR